MCGVLREESSVASKYEFIETMRLDTMEYAYPVEFMCERLDVSKSGYYEWRGRPDSATALCAHGVLGEACSRSACACVSAAKLSFSIHGVLTLRPSQKASPKLMGTRALARCGLPTALMTQVTVSLMIKAQPAR